MVVELSGRQIFLASPTSLETERELVRNRIDFFNRTHGWPQGVHFIDRGWERDTPGGVGRPQDQINAVLDDCDYMILLIAERWGSNPGGTDGYTSGTEEEFHHARQLLGETDAHLRNVLILFHQSALQSTDNPDQQLQHVLDFRRDVEATRAFLYLVWDTHDSLQSKVDAALADWSRPLQERTPVVISWPPRIPAQDTTTTPDAVAQSQALLDSGLWTQAEGVLRRASVGGDHSATAAYAKLARRDGRWETALALNQSIIDRSVLHAQDPEARIHLADALSNIGVIERKLGRLTESARHLSEAAATIRSDLPASFKAFCYALDNLGHTLLRRGLVNDARAAYAEALDIRVELAAPIEQFQSAVNVARADLQSGDFAAAEAAFTALLPKLPPGADQHLVANVKCGLAEALLRQGNANLGDLLSDAIAANEAGRNTDGLSIAYGLSARQALLRGDVERAETMLRLVDSQSGDTENVSGRGTALVLRARLRVTQGDNDTAARLLDEARTVASVASNPLLDMDISALEDALAGERSPTV